MVHKPDGASASRTQKLLAGIRGDALDEDGRGRKMAILQRKAARLDALDLAQRSLDKTQVAADKEGIRCQVTGCGILRLLRQSYAA
jgi:hypothetical protein